MNQNIIPAALECFALTFTDSRDATLEHPLNEELNDSSYQVRQVWGWLVHPHADEGLEGRTYMQGLVYDDLGRFVRAEYDWGGMVAFMGYFGSRLDAISHLENTPVSSRFPAAPVEIDDGRILELDRGATA